MLINTLYKVNQRSDWHQKMVKPVKWDIKQEIQTHQPQCLVSRNLHCDEDIMVCHIQDDLVLRDQHVTAAVRVRTEGGVGVA